MEDFIATLSFGMPGETYIREISEVKVRLVNFTELYFIALHWHRVCCLQTEGKALCQQKGDNSLCCDTRFIMAAWNHTWNAFEVRLYVAVGVKEKELKCKSQGVSRAAGAHGGIVPFAATSVS